MSGDLVFVKFTRPVYTIYLLSAGTNVDAAAVAQDLHIHGQLAAADLNRLRGYLCCRVFRSADKRKLLPVCRTLRKNDTKRICILVQAFQRDGFRRADLVTQAGQIVRMLLSQA